MSQDKDNSYWSRRFLEYLEIEKGRSLKTIEAYSRYLKRFFKHSQVKNPSDIVLDHVREFRLYLNRQKTRNGTMKPVTQNKYLIALRSYLKYLERQDIPTLAAAKIELAKTPQREIDIMTEAEFNRLMDVKKRNAFIGARDHAILQLLYSTGLRVSELCSLTTDLDISADEFTIRGKGEKLRIVFISPDARRAVKNYLEIRNNDEIPMASNALFVTKKGTALYPRAIQRMIEKRSTEAGIMNPVTPHSLRHYFATSLLRNGADIRSVQMMLGHASINTTQVYTNISDKFLREVHKKFHNKDGPED